MQRRQFLQLAAGALAGHTLAAACCPISYRLRVAPSGIVVSSGGGPIHVAAGERVLFHFSKSGVMDDVLLHLPGHRFSVVALDGYPVPTPAAVDVLALAAGERIAAIVQMDVPGNWLLGALDNSQRESGLSVPVAYAKRNGIAQWHAPTAIDWSYARFSSARRAPDRADESIEMLYEAGQWMVNGQHCPEVESMRFQPGRQYRLRMINATSRALPLHLRHHRLQLTRVNQIPVAGIIKDTVRIERYNAIEADVL